MKAASVKRRWLGALAAAALAFGASAAPAQGAVGDPLQVISGGFEDPCGIAIDIAGNFYVSDYYHHSVNPRKATGATYGTPLSGEDPENGPCGLGIDSEGSVYVNNYHQSVVRFTSHDGSNWGPGRMVDSDDPTGVAVDTKTSNPLTTDDVYVDNRTHISVYEPSGAPVEVAGQPLQIGGGTAGGLEEGYGLAISRYPLTEGRIYVADAADNTVKIYNQLAETAPVATIAGPGGQLGTFHSLVDSAVAVDSNTGEVYVSDSLGSPFTEHPEAAIYVFSATGIYLGRLKYNVIDGGPVGLAVDNTSGANKGRVYVTSGNSSGGTVYVYPPGSAISSGLPAVFTLSVARGGNGAGSIRSSIAGVDCEGACQAELPAGERAVLTATPASGSTFAGWSGGSCSGTGTCAVTMSQARSVSADFQALPTAAAQPGGAAASTAQPASSAAAASGGGATPAPRRTHRHRAIRRRHPRHARRRHARNHNVKHHRRHRNGGHHR